MKRAILALLMAVLLLAGCSSEPQVRESYTVIMDGVSLTVDPESKTITDGKDTYHFDADEDQISITYPNGAVYTKTYHRSDDDIGDTVSGGWSGEDTLLMMGSGNPYLDGDTLADAVSEEMPEMKEPFPVGLFLISLLVAAYGVWCIAAPETVVHYQLTRWIRGAEPSDAAIGVTTGCGILLVVGGLVLVLICFL